MGQLIQIEVENFKSYRGNQIIGPFDKFTSIIGPNGAGKSNLMDAISFVLGVKSAQLRSAQLKDLIFNSEEIEKASVSAIYMDRNGQQVKLKRSIHRSGLSEYWLNDDQVTYTQYIQYLEQHDILVKTKNFLVFQVGNKYVYSGWMN
jgi:structural maintenance of chromosome 1